MGGAILAVAVVGAASGAPLAVPVGIPDPSFPWWALPVVPAILMLVRWRRWHALHRAARTVNMRPAAAMGGFVLVLLLGMLGILLASRGLGLDGKGPDDLRGQVLSMGAAFLGQVVAVLLLWRLLRRSGGVVAAGSGRAALIGLASLALAWPLVLATVEGWHWVSVWLGRAPGEAVAHDLLRLLVSSARDGWWWTGVGAAVVMAPVLEEILYRGLLQGAFRAALGDRSPWIAIVLASVVFAAMHVPAADSHAVAGLFVLSLCLGWAMERTGRLAAPVVMHVGFNLGNIAFALAIAA